MKQKIQTRGLSSDVITGRAPSRGSQCCVVGLLLRSHHLEAGDTPQRQAALFRVVTITVCLHLNKSSGVLFASSIEGLDEAAASFQRSSLRASECEEWVPGVWWTRLLTALSCPGTLACLTLGHMLRMVQVHLFPEWKAWFASRAGTRFEKPTLCMGSGDQVRLELALWERSIHRTEKGQSLLLRASAGGWSVAAAPHLASCLRKQTPARQHLSVQPKSLGTHLVTCPCCIRLGSVDWPW